MSEIHKDDESLVMQKLNIYKLRSDVELEIKKNVSVFIISKDSEEVIKTSPNLSVLMIQDLTIY